MTAQIITLTPALASMLWVLYIKLRQKEFKEAAMLSLASVCVCINAILVYKMTTSDISVWLHIVQMTACSCIIPLIYTYLSNQLGRTRNNLVTMLLWLFAALSFVPNVIVSNPFEPFLYPETPMKPFALYVLSHGQKIFAIYMGDLMVALQAILTIFLIFPLALWIKRNGLRFNPKIYAFGIWWIFAIVAIVMISCMTYDDFRNPTGEWFYFTLYSLMIVSLNILIALRFDLHSVQTEDGDAVNDLNSYIIEQYRALAQQMQELVEQEKLYLQPECSAEQMVERLHTNRTYFSQMMSSVYGTTFSEYINALRLDYAKKLLKETNLTISEISYQCGYSDGGYMGRKFREKYSMSPTEWRKQA